MTKFLKILILIISVQIITIDPAFAVIKLSSVYRESKAILTRIGDIYNEVHEEVDKVATEVQEVVLKAKNGELAAKAEKYVADKATDTVKGKIDEQLQQKFEEIKQKKKNLEKFENKLADIMAKKDDYIAALNDAKMEKIKQIDEHLTELKAKVQSITISDDELSKIVAQIADSEAQKQHILDEPVEDETYQGLEDEAKKIAHEVENSKAEVSQVTLQEKLQEQSQDLFDDKIAESENQSIYQTEIEALFLKETEETTSENIARIKKNRQRAYYEALQNAMDVAVIGTAASAQVEEQVGQYVEMSADVDGNYALKNTNVAIIIENAKAAARFTEALLAEVRLKTSQDMTSWNNKYHLYDYKKPVTEFDFDSYELKKSNLLDKGKTLLEGNKDKLKDLWHKI